MVEGAQLLSRTAFSVGRRILSGTSYPGLAELIAAFYSAVAAGGTSPVQPEHLLRVTDLFEALAAKVETAARKPGPSRASAPPCGAAQLAVVTGARGFLGAEIARALSRVRGTPAIVAAQQAASAGRTNDWQAQPRMNVG